MNLRFSGVIAIAVLLIVEAGCSDSNALAGLSASSICKDYLSQTHDEQDVAVQRIAGQQHNGNALTPAGRPNVDYLCGNNPDLKLGDAIAQAGGKSGATRSAAGSPAESGTGTATACASTACFTEPDTVTTLLAAAKTAVAATDSYDYRTLSSDTAKGLSYTTGTYRRQYRDAMTGLISENAPKQHFTQRAKIHAAGIQMLSAGLTTASVLVFGQLNITNTATGPSGRVDPFVLTAALLRVDGRWLINQVVVPGSGTADATHLGSQGLGNAVTSSAAEVTNLLTFSRAHFDSDFDKAVAGATGQLRSDIEGKRSSTLSAITAGHFDLRAEIDADAVMSAEGSTVVVLLAVSGYRVTGGNKGTATKQSLIATVTKTGSQWLVSNVENDGVS